MLTVKTSQISSLVLHIAVELRQPLMLWGPPGIGKTDIMSDATMLARKGAPKTKVSRYEAVPGLVPVLVSQYESVDLRGLPSIEDGVTTWNMPSTLPFIGNPAFDHLSDKHPIVLFFDEINAASPAVYAVLYQLICNGRVGEHVLRPNVCIVAAGNREGDRGVTTRMPLPLANRLNHVETVVDEDYWCDWALREGLPEIGVAFIQFRKVLLNTFDPSKPDKAFATPRSWAKALKAYAAPIPADIKSAAIAGAVGVGPMTEFLAFENFWQKAKGMIPRILKDPKKEPLPPEDEPAIAYAIAVCISGEMTPENCGALNIYLERMRPELTVLAWRLALTRDKSLYSTPEFTTFTSRYKQAFA